MCALARATAIPSSPSPIRVIPVTLLGRTADSAWAKVQMVDGTQGWVNSSALNTTVPVNTLPINETPITPPAGMAVGAVNTGQLNIRSGPGAGYSCSASVYYGHVVQLLGRNYL